jgi:hypothetical protein
MNDPISRRRQLRRDFLEQLYTRVDGSVSEFVSGLEIGAALGADDAETLRVIAYLEEKQLVKVDDHRAGIIRITAHGVDEVESRAG